MQLRPAREGIIPFILIGGAIWFISWLVHIPAQATDPLLHRIPMFNQLSMFLQSVIGFVVAGLFGWYILRLFATVRYYGVLDIIAYTLRKRTNPFIVLFYRAIKSPRSSEQRKVAENNDKEERVRVLQTPSPSCAGLSNVMVTAQPTHHPVDGTLAYHTFRGTSPNPGSGDAPVSYEASRCLDIEGFQEKIRNGEFSTVFEGILKHGYFHIIAEEYTVSDAIAYIVSYGTQAQYSSEYLEEKRKQQHGPTIKQRISNWLKEIKAKFKK